jgi:DNA-binding CsgD family transcriptional regulator
MGAITYGVGRVAVITGEAGIGKSRLIADAKKVALIRGLVIAQGQCFQADANYPYAPLLDLLRTFLPTHLPAITAAGQEPLVRELVQLLPDLAFVLPQFAQCDSPQPTAHANLDSPDPERQKRRIMSILTHLLVEQTAQKPLALVIEDIHWCDESTLDFLLHLARRTTRTPLFLLFTLRNEDISPHMGHWLSQLNRERLAVELELVRLSPTEVGAMAQAILATRSLKRSKLIKDIYTLTEGNPFFVEEVLKSLITSGDLRVVDGKWTWKYTRGKPGEDGGASLIPRSVQGVIQQQIARLSADAQQAVTAAAAVGRRFDFTVLQRLMACDERRLIALMKELIAAQLVVEESADQFVFRHALIQQAIVGVLLARERRSLHLAVANALESLFTTPPQREAHLADLATHFYAACSWAKALEYAQRAGDKALALYAPRAAIEHATHALDAARRMHIAPSGNIYYTCGKGRETLGEFDWARKDYRRALNAARRDADVALQWQSMTALGFLWAERDYSQAGEWFRRASFLANRLADPGMQARSLNRLGNWLGNTGRIEEGLQAHRDALTIFEEHRNRQGMAETLDLLSTLDGMRGDRMTAVAELGQAIALFRTLGDTQNLISSLAMRAIQSMPGANETTCCPQRTQDECVRDASESLRLSRQIDSLAGQSFAEVALAHVLSSFGEFGSALAHAHEAQRIAREIEHQQWLVSTCYALGRAYVHLLAPDQAITALATGLSLARELGSAFWTATLSAYAGRAYILNHDLTAAQAILQPMMPREQLPRTIAERDVALTWGELAQAQGEPEVALQIAEHLLATVPGQQPEQPTQPIPHLLRLQGEALLDLSRFDEAVAALENARRGAMERNARPLLWTIHRSLGRAHQFRQRNDEARQEIAAARRLIGELAATIEDSALRATFTQAALGSLPQEKSIHPREATRQAFGGLTTREREVVALLAEGKTSRQIADALVVSERTAEVHVSNILKKLGFSSRTQVAVWAVERGLTH